MLELDEISEKGNNYDRLMIDKIWRDLTLKRKEIMLDTYREVDDAMEAIVKENKDGGVDVEIPFKINIGGLEQAGDLQLKLDGD